MKVNDEPEEWLFKNSLMNVHIEYVNVIIYMAPICTSRSMVNFDYFSFEEYGVSQKFIKSRQMTQIIKPHTHIFGCSSKRKYISQTNVCQRIMVAEK